MQVTDRTPALNTACTEFTDDEIASAVAGTLDDVRAGLLFEHLPDCAACQARMHHENIAFKSRRHVAQPGKDESDEAIMAFLSRVQINPPSVAEYKPGELIDQYKVISRIGKGGSSVVYLCLDPALGRQVALKVLTQPFLSRSLRERHEREARTLARLDHPWIVKAHEINSQHFPPYIVMEYVAGGSSSRLVATRPISPDSAARLVAGVADAVQHAHDHGIMHRDIKPSNLLVVGQFDPERGISPELTLKVSDFGLARTMSDNSALTSTDNIIGTPAYMSPEQARGSQKEIRPVSDVYSIGIVLYEYLIGRPPLVAENAVTTLRLVNEVDPVAPRLIRPGIPRDLDTICLKCLRKNKEERYAFARELAEDLRRFLEGRPIIARPIGPLNRVYRWARRKPGLAAAISVSLALATALVSVSFMFGIMQGRLLNQAEQNASLFREAARRAAEESDFSRNLFIASVRNSEGFLKEAKALKSLEDLPAVTDKIAGFNKIFLEEYIKRMQQPEALRAEAFESFFRDAVAFRELGHAEVADKMLQQLIDQSLKLAPEHPDYHTARIVAIKSISSMAYTHRQQGRNSQARAMLEKYVNNFQANFSRLDVSLNDLLISRAYLDTYIDSLRDDGQNQRADLFEPQRNQLSKRILELVNTESNQPASQ